MTASNQQIFFDGHTDDITCVTLDSLSGLVATGQTGKKPFVLIWDSVYCTTNGEFCGDHGYQVSHSSGLVTKIGDGFFLRGVCAVSFSFDVTYVCAISCDDNHTLGIWDIETKTMVLTSPCHSGVPPQIKSLKWCPAPQYAAYISKEAKGLCDVFCTAGERHLKIWAFNREAASNPKKVAGGAPLLYNKAAIMGKVSDCWSLFFISLT